MKKILYIVSTLQRTGPVNQLFNLIRYLDRDKFKPFLLTLSPEPTDSRWQDYEAIDVVLFSLRLSRIGGGIYAKRKLENLIDEIRPDLIHTQGIRSDILSSKIKFPIPKICTVRNFPQNDYPMRYGKLRGSMMVKIHMNALKKIDLCVGVSRAVELNLNKVFSILNTDVISNGVNTDIYFPISKDKKLELRKKLDLPEEAKIWISSGHLSLLKDPVFLIEQWLRLFNNSRKNFLLFIGDGDLNSRCIELANRSKNILFRGRVSNVADYLQSSDYFVSSSKSEGLPNSVIEALACGLPCLLSDIPSHSEICAMDNLVGGLFVLGSSDSFKDGITKLQNSDYLDMKKSALKLAFGKLSAEVMSKNYQKHYASFLGV